MVYRVYEQLKAEGYDVAPPPFQPTRYGYF